MRLTRTKLWLGLIVAVSIATYAYETVQREKGRHDVTKMTENMKTVCVGRFLIDLPANAQHILNGAFVDGFNISVSDETSEQFLGRLAAREAEINLDTNSLGRKNMESVKPVNVNGFTGSIFTFGRSSSYTLDGDIRRVHEAVKLEAYAHAGSKTFDFIADGYDPAQTGNLNKLLGQLRAVPADTIPSEPGFCFGLGMLHDPISASQAEKIVLFASLPGHPDVAFAFNTMAGLKRTWPTLLKRRAEVDADKPLWIRSRFSALRSGPRTVNGLAGEEVAIKVTEMNFSTVFGFDWELAGTEDDVFAPAMHLEMSTGNNPKADGEPVQSSLNQQAAIELWDKIVSSIRVRPTVDKAVSVAPPSPVATVGTVSAAGDICPQTGWWQCRDADQDVKVLGGQRQYLRQGQRVPQALLLPPQTLWEKFRRLQPSYETKSPTLWKLADRRLRYRTAITAPLAQPGAADATEYVQYAATTVIGRSIATGVMCPASGWWRCEDLEALDGVRWFSRGSLLPAATFRVRLDGNKDAKNHTVIHRRSVWRLVRLDDAPDHA